MCLSGGCGWAIVLSISCWMACGVCIVGCCVWWILLKL